MRIKEFERTANVAWSPSDHHPIYLAAGTAAQQLDATFSTNASMEIFHLNLADSDLEMPMLASVSSDCRFHKVLWSPLGVGKHESGIVIAGTDHGSILGWDPVQMMAGVDEPVFRRDKHTGAVKALHFSPYQSNLLASGASDSEIFIWDLNTNNPPMAPGPKSQPSEEVASVAWNNQVQHILGSTFATRCVVWDLRKSEPIIKISDSMARIKCKHIEWHPEVATQLCLSSEDDHTPVIQLWDLRFATSPLKTLENHKRGVLSIAWCPRDPDLLLSCGKDNRILCWNPSSNVQGGEVIYDLPTSGQWCFDVQWCPRNPNVICSSSVDGHVNVYSLMGGGHPLKPSNRITESFSNVDSFSTPVTQVPHEEESVISLRQAPRWLKKPVGASFAFGGKLVTFGANKPPSTQTTPIREVHISQVVTETQLIHKSNMLEQALLTNQFSEFCTMKIENSCEPLQDNIWSFLKVNFESDPRTQYLELLGYDKANLTKEVFEKTKSYSSKGIDADILAEKMSDLSTSSKDGTPNLVASGHGSPYINSKASSRDELSDVSSAFDDIAQQHAESTLSDTSLVIPQKSDQEGLMTEALLTGNFQAAVEMCIHDNNMAEAILLAIAGGNDLLIQTQQRFFQRNKSRTNKLLSCILNQDWKTIVETCDLSNWKEALAVIMTYSSNQDLAMLCDILGGRMETENSHELSPYASLCYICSGNLNKLVDNWIRNNKNENSPTALQDLVEKVMVLTKAVEKSHGQAPPVTSSVLAEKLSTYAASLAAQGSMETAISYLGNSDEMPLAILRDRLYKALGRVNPLGTQPPFSRVDVQNVAPVKPAQLQQQSNYAHHPGYQTQARGTFQTVTTPSSGPYYSAPQYGIVQPDQPQSIYQGTVSSIGYTAPVTTEPSTTTGFSAKGRGRYPAYPQTSNLDPYSQNTYMQPAFQQPAPSQPQQFYNPAAYIPQTAGQQVPANIYDPLTMMQPPPTGSYGPPAPVSAATGERMTGFQDHRPPTAWNDPPPIREKKLSGSYDQHQPITQPLYALPEQPQPVQSYPNLYNPQQNQPAPQQAVAPMQSHVEPPTPVIKAEIPQEHKVLQDIFNNLVNTCITKATNPQMKRKLDDVMRKLELLYDKLRTNSLSANVVLGLHQIIQAVQQFDYASGLSIYTQIVSHENFSEISSFMPGLKILLQTAAQLQVYVQ